MIESIIKGGFGNNLFQIATISAMAWDNDDEEIYDSNIDRNIFPNIPKKKVAFTGKITDVPFDQKPIYQKNATYNGYFQDPTNFDHHREKILELFRPSEHILNAIEKKYGSILNGNVCSVHVRRGDYLKYPGIYNILKMDYYQNAMNFVNADSYLIFSDDIKWCKRNFSDSCYFIQDDLYVDFIVMSLCKHNIIANSTYSWWAAFLNQNEEKMVIAPQQWFSNKISSKKIIPKSWMLI